MFLKVKRLQVESWTWNSNDTVMNFESCMKTRVQCTKRRLTGIITGISFLDVTDFNLRSVP